MSSKEHENGVEVEVPKTSHEKNTQKKRKRNLCEEMQEISKKVFMEKKKQSEELIKQKQNEQILEAETYAERILPDVLERIKEAAENGCSVIKYKIYNCKEHYIEILSKKLNSEEYGFEAYGDYHFPHSEDFSVLSIGWSKK
jgi:hypothetical protein